MRMDPPVSLPMATGARPAATATADPLLEPPAMWCTVGAAGFQGVPFAWFVPQLPMANSTICVVPSKIAPASSRRRKAGAVTLAAAEV